MYGMQCVVYAVHATILQCVILLVQQAHSLLICILSDTEDALFTLNYTWLHVVRCEYINYLNMI